MKILGDGELTVKLTLDVDKVSATARTKIEAAGGSATERTLPKVKSERARPVTAAADEEEEAPSEPAEAPAEATEPEAPAPRARRSRAKAEDEGEASSEE